ncbi:PBP1A family penicillin-binding protein [Rhodobacteraceae bacterium RKSG542]|nr:PBP1A family penicillin-binding protein [Pseudovibrio flavus]
MRPRKSGKKGGRSWIVRAFRFCAYWSLVAGIWGAIIATCVLIYYGAHLPPASEWAVPQRPPNVRVIAANGNLIANRGDTGGEAIRLEQLPSYLPNAVIAIEDRRFRYHFGIDPIGLFRAAVTNYTSGRTVQGGSTLTQQLAKNLFLKPERTFKRKVQEAVMALWLEANYSKDEILEMYLNRVYLGAGAYGVDAAARRYYGKSARLVTIAEAATIAGLLKAPSRYAPTRNPALAESRAHLVLTAMHDEGFITAQETKDALISPAKVSGRFNQGGDNYVADYVMDLLPSYVGGISEDLIVDTTIDVDMQNAAEQALTSAIREHRGDQNVTQGAIVTLNGAGAIRAMVGGYSYSQSQYNRAVYAKRQPGSAFKPFVFLTALESGMSPYTMRTDRPITIGNWSPKNYTNRYYGDVNLTYALANSINTISVQLGREVKPSQVVKTARRLGISSPLKANNSLALGTSEVTPLEMTASYVPFANGGYGIVPHIVRRITTEEGKVLYNRSSDGLGRVIRGDKVSEINTMMAHVVANGTGRKAQLEGRPVGGKTGTTQGFRDAWFIGYTGSLTTGVWLGNDNNSPMKKVTGGKLPAEIWQKAMTAMHANVPVTRLPGVPLHLGPIYQGSQQVAPRPQAPSGFALPPQGMGTPSPNYPQQQQQQAPQRSGPMNLLNRLFGG